MWSSRPVMQSSFNFHTDLVEHGGRSPWQLCSENCNSSFQEINDGGSAEGYNRKRKRGRERSHNFFLLVKHIRHLNTHTKNKQLVYIIHSCSELLLVPLWKEAVINSLPQHSSNYYKGQYSSGRWMRIYDTLLRCRWGGCCGKVGIILGHIS